MVTSDVNRRVTLRLVEVPWNQALNLLINTNGLGKEQIGNVVRISTATQLKTERDAVAAARKSEKNFEPLQTVYFNVNYATVKDLEAKVKTVLSKRPDAVLVVDEWSNMTMIRDVKTDLEDTSTLVARLDTRTPQVLIESNLIETTPTFARALGLELNFDAPIYNNIVADRSVQVRSSFPAGSPAGATPFFSVIQNRVGALRNLSARLSAAEEEGRIKIISRPSVVTLNNVQSTIQSLRILRVKLPENSTSIATGTGASAGAAVATEKIPVGVTLTVTPQVSSDGFVLMNIMVKSSSVGTASPGLTVPDEISREAISNVLVRDGETIVIGGIMKDTTQESEAGIPYLKDIPIIGWMFKRIRWQKDFEELVVFITPRVVSGGSENLPSAEQLWREQMKKTEGG